MESSNRCAPASTDEIQNQVDEAYSPSDLKAAFDRLFDPEDQEGSKLLHDIYAVEDARKSRSCSPHRAARNIRSLTPPRYFVRSWVQTDAVRKLSKG
jgi:hypothetical protein